MPKLYRHTVQVHFRGAFPVDMLRYDRCSPFSEQDSYRIERSLRHDYDQQTDISPVTVVKTSPEKSSLRTWTVARWQSFSAELREFAFSPVI